jgi:hypothetical protein
VTPYVIVEKRRSGMDSTDTGDKAPEEKPEAATPGEGITAEATPPETAAVKQPPAGEAPPAATPPSGVAPIKHNWTLIALIVVSCVAVLLLAATIALAVTGSYDHHHGYMKLERNENFRMGPMMRGRGSDGWQNRVPAQPKNPADKNQQSQPPQTAPAPSSQATPPSPSG